MKPRTSLRRRILATTFITFIVVLLFAGYALDKAFQRVVRSNTHSQLKNLTYALLASADISPGGEILIPPQLPQSDITIPESGRYAVIVDNTGKPVWRSPSSLGVHLEQLQPLAPGHADFEPNKDFSEKPFIFRFGTVWGAEGLDDIFLTFVYIQDKSQYREQIGGYRETLVQWLSAGAILLLLIHGWILLLELRPLARIVREIDDIDQGRSLSIKGQYPAELARLSQRINGFIQKERSLLDGYRHSLDDLAHSLKTPLAVIRGMDHTERDDHNGNELREQLDRMTEIIDYQLKRAATAGQTSLAKTQTELMPVVTRIRSSLLKVYADKAVECSLEGDDALRFPGDKDDCYEVVGNLCDNAFKLCKRQVSIHCYIEKEALISAHPERKKLIINIEDDGPGISEQLSKEITRRGVRGDLQTPGQGIGLAVVQNILRPYGGSLSFHNSSLGGALVKVDIPLE